jgi:hypothetical protein
MEHKHPISIDFASKEILIEVFRDILVFTILPHYKERKRYNLSLIGPRPEVFEADSDDSEPLVG